MQGVIVTLQQWHLHPIIDHFTVAIFVLAVITDLVASLFSTRQWLRYSALSLVILAALLTWGSTVTGQWAQHQVMTAVKAAGGPALAILNRHAWLGEDILPWLISVLAIWRIGIQLLNFIARSRPFYLLIAIAAMALISYEGYIGGELVYDYGVGTAIYTAQATPSPAAMATPSGPATPMPTVYVPTATATPSASGTATPSGAPESATPGPSPAAKGTAGTSAATATPSGAAESSSMAATPSASPAPSTSATAPPSNSGEEPKAESAPSSIPSTAIRPPAPRAGATSL